MNAEMIGFHPRSWTRKQDGTAARAAAATAGRAGPYHQAGRTTPRSIMSNLALYALFFGVPLVFGLWAQHRIKSTFQKYSEVPEDTGMTGAQVARQILDANGLQGVPVNAVAGALSDHYDPRSRSVNLSEPVYGAATISSTAVAAHEVGHAIQHAKAYFPMTVRDRKSTRLNSSHIQKSRMPSSA